MSSTSVCDTVGYLSVFVINIVITYTEDSGTTIGSRIGCIIGYRDIYVKVTCSYEIHVALLDNRIYAGDV